MLHLDCNTQDVAAKLFEAFREEIREEIKQTPSNHIVSPSSIYWMVNIGGEEDYLHNCATTFRFINESFYYELYEELIHYIEGEIEA